MIFGGQLTAVRPSGFGRRRRPRHLQMIEAQRGAATRSVVAKKQLQRQEEETMFGREQSEKSLAMQEEQAASSLAFQQQQQHLAKKAARDQKRLGKINTGVNLLNTIMSFFG